MTQIKIDNFELCPDISGDSEHDTLLLRAIYEKAKDYIASFRWEPSIKAMYFAAGVGGVLALFLVRFDRAINDLDDTLWVTVGDLPSAYFVTDDAPDPASALEIYCELMDGWANAVLAGKSLSHFFPVPDAPTKDNANALRSRIEFLRSDIMPMLKTLP